MIYVLDASAGIEIALNNERAGALMPALSKASRMIMTDLYKAETTNVMWRYCKAGFL
jgi:uncharacterized protein with PIN domain